MQAFKFNSQLSNSNCPHWNRVLSRNLSTVSFVTWCNGTQWSRRGLIPVKIGPSFDNFHRVHILLISANSCSTILHYQLKKHIIVSQVTVKILAESKLSGNPIHTRLRMRLEGTAFIVPNGLTNFKIPQLKSCPMPTDSKTSKILRKKQILCKHIYFVFVLNPSFLPDTVYTTCVVLSFNSQTKDFNE